MKKIFLLSLFIFISQYLYAQQGWQWGKRGGSSTQAGTGVNETLHDIAADKNGNVYALSYVYNSSLNIDGIPVAGYGGTDIMVSSFSCDGTYRWHKLIGANSGDYGVAIRTDTMGGVTLPDR